MTDDTLHDAPLEPERYELWADEDLLEPSRRAFLRIVGGGVVHTPIMIEGGRH